MAALTAGMGTMALTDQDIMLFARDAVDCHPDVFAANDETAKQRRIAAHRRVACSYYAKAQASVRGSGYRVTKRVRDGLWAELRRIEAAAMAPVVLDAAEVSSVKMVAGGEKRHPVIVHEGEVKRWIGFGWVTEREATRSDLARFPFVR